MTKSTLSKLTARDLMKSKVLLLNPRHSLEEAVRTLADMKISGAPVVDSAGKLVGVLSSRDIARPEHIAGREAAARSGNYEFAEASADDDGSFDEEFLSSTDGYSAETLLSGTVSDVMSTDPITVEPDASIRTICALMTREGIHRVIVVERGKVVGIVATSDIVRAVAEAL